MAGNNCFSFCSANFAPFLRARPLVLQHKLLSYPGLKLFLSYRANSSFSSETSYSGCHKTFPCFLRSCLLLVLSCQFSDNLQSAPEEHNLAAFNNASASLTATCGIHGTVYEYIHIYFLLEVSNSDCLLSSILHR